MIGRRGSPLVALLLILVGGWLLAQNFDVPLPDLRDLWPVLLIVLGVAFWIRYFSGGRTDTGLVFVGTLAVFLGLFFQAFTLKYLSWSRDMGRYWPVFLLIVGAAFLLQWLTQPRQRGLLIPALLSLTIGLICLLFTLRLASTELIEQTAKFWPALLILIGLGLLGGGLFRPRQKG